MREKAGLILLVILLTACSRVVVEPVNNKHRSGFNLFKPVSGKSVVYVYRDDALLDGYYASKLIMNGYPVANGAINSFNILILPPGDYDIGVTSSFQKGDYVPTDVTFHSGEVHYLKVYWEKDSGFRIRAVLDSRAKKVIATGRLIAIKELCPDYLIDHQQKKKLGNSQVMFRPYQKGLCSGPP